MTTARPKITDRGRGVFRELAVLALYTSGYLLGHALWLLLVW